MKIRIIQSKPRRSRNEYDIDQLIDEEFEVVQRDEDGFYIRYGHTGLYYINNDEAEIIESTESPSEAAAE
ncbi:hypothetical protein [Gorillibacterium sp. CAU 1737]|uniref:hypothetical protein n=1 Tax=Gorillibacterium sp. CAU 1737 TaxID=3140362 RepID=UPI0032617ED9